MGYLTRYTLPLISPIDRRDAFRTWLVDRCDVSLEILDGQERAAWYDHDIDVVAAMRATGVTGVLLHAIGEDPHDAPIDKQFTQGVDDTITLYRYKYAMVRDIEPYKTELFHINR